MPAGRNDPCPCGSGKKYKQCHLRQDQVAASRDHTLLPAEGMALNALFGFATSPRFARPLVEAFQRYWGGTYTPASASKLGPEPFRRMIEWFACDYPIDDEGNRVIDLHLQGADAAPQEVRQVLEAWADAPMGAFRITRFADADQVTLLDLLREEQLEARSRFVTLNARQGDLLLGRYVRVGDRPTLSPMTAIYPPELEEPLLAYVRRAFAVYQEEHFQADWDAFLKRNGHIFQAFLISDKAEPFRRLIGPGTPYIDPASVRDALRETTQQEARERHRDRQPDRRPAAGERRPSGIIVPGAPEPQPPAERKPKEEDQGGDRPRILIPGRDT